MKYIVISIKDALKGYGGLQLVDNEPVAIRDFTNAVNNSELIKKNLPDYSMYKMGIYDTEKGTIDSKGCPELMMSASDVAIIENK